MSRWVHLGLHKPGFFFIFFFNKSVGASFNSIQEEANQLNVLLKFVAFSGVLSEAAFWET